MGVVGGPSAWAVDRFGAGRATVLYERIPIALTRTVERAMDAREASALDTDHAFGPVRWKAQYEELHHQLRDLPDVTDFQPHGAQIRITLCAGNLLLPWHYSSKGDVDVRNVRPNRRLSRLVRELLGLYGPAPRYAQPSLPGLDAPATVDRSELREAVEKLADEPRVVLVAYACNSDAGLLRVCWGDAALVRPDELEWTHVEDLPFPQPA